MLFPKALAWSERQTALSRIWTRVTDSISYDDTGYAKAIPELSCKYAELLRQLLLKI